MLPIGLLRDVVLAAGGVVLAALLLAYLHGELQPGWAVAAAVVGAVAIRRMVAVAYEGLPLFLADPIDIGVSAVGVALASWATLGLYPRAYWVLRWRPAIGLAVGAALLGVGLATAVYTHRRLARDIERQEARLAELRERALKAQLGALQAHVHPHFLFNALNTLAEVVHEDPDEAEDLIADLAHMMRYALRSTTGQVPLGQELDNVARYLRLEHARLGERLRVEVDTADALRQTAVPGFLLQPLVENAVQHAIATRPEGGMLRVMVGSREGAVTIAVEDDGPGLPDAVQRRLAGEDDGTRSGTEGAGGGLANVQRRLELAVGGRLRVSRPDGGGTRIELAVPVPVPVP